MLGEDEFALKGGIFGYNIILYYTTLIPHTVTHNILYLPFGVHLIWTF